MALGVVRVIEREVLRPITILGQLQKLPKEWRIAVFNLDGADLNLHAVGKTRLRRQHHHAILDCPFVGHTEYLTRKPSQKQAADTAPRNPSPTNGLEM